ncbi:MAG: hypothetical protein ABI333_23945 [bacterium]
MSMIVNRIVIVVSICTCAGLVAACGVDPELHRRTVARADRNQQRFEQASQASARLRARRDHWKTVAARSQAQHRDTVSKLMAVRAALAQAQEKLKVCRGPAPGGGVVDPRILGLGSAPTPEERRRRERALQQDMSRVIGRGQLTAQGASAFLKGYYTKKLKECGDRHLPVPSGRRRRRGRRRQPPILDTKSRFSATVTLTITVAGNGRVRRVSVPRSNPKHRPLRRCLEKAVSKIVFPTPKGNRKLRFTYTVKLDKPYALKGLFD